MKRHFLLYPGVLQVAATYHGCVKRLSHDMPDQFSALLYHPQLATRIRYNSGLPPPFPKPISLISDDTSSVPQPHPMRHLP